MRVVISDAGGNRHEQVAARAPSRSAIAERRRDHLGRDVGQVERWVSHMVTAVMRIAVEQRRAGEREAVAADHAAFARLREGRCQRRNLLCFLALVAGKRARESVEQQVLAVVA